MRGRGEALGRCRPFDSSAFIYRFRPSVHLSYPVVFDGTNYLGGAQTSG